MDTGFIDDKRVGDLICRDVDTVTCELRLELAKRLISLASKIIYALDFYVVLKLTNTYYDTVACSCQDVSRFLQ